MPDDDDTPAYSKEFFANGWTPSGFGIAQDGCDIFATSPCCGAMIDWYRYPNCYRCKNELITPGGMTEGDYSICLSFDSPSAMKIRDFCAAWSGWDADLLDVVVGR